MSFIIISVTFIVYMIVTTTYIGYINYFEYSSSVLAYTSWGCALFILLALLYKARNRPNQINNVKRFFMLFGFSILIGAMFRIGPVGNIAVIYHIFLGEQIALITKVSRSNDNYFIYKGCRGKLKAFNHSKLKDETLCGIGFEDWKTIEPDTPMLLIGTQSYFGINFERYAIPALSSRELILNKLTDVSDVVYVRRSEQGLELKTKRLIYRNFD